MSWFWVKPTINKNNGQINVSLPKKAMSKRQLHDIYSRERIKIFFEGRKMK